MFENLLEHGLNLFLFDITKSYTTLLTEQVRTRERVASHTQAFKNSAPWVKSMNSLDVVVPTIGCDVVK